MKDYLKIIENKGFTTHEQLENFLNENSDDVIWSYSVEDVDHLISEQKHNGQVLYIPIDLENEIRLYEYFIEEE